MSEENTIRQPQINWYREYQLEPNANVSMELTDDTARLAFENSLYRKIWGGILEEGQNYQNQATVDFKTYFTFTYGINEAGVGCEKSMLFGITLRHDKKEEEGKEPIYEITTGYLFIIAAYSGKEQNDSVRIRTQQLVVIPNTEFVDESKTDTIGTKTTMCGIRVTGGDIVIGIKKVEPTGEQNTTCEFYFPLKSFFLEGRHQDPVKFVEGYDGKFAITLLSA